MRTLRWMGCRLWWLLLVAECAAALRDVPASLKEINPPPWTDSPHIIAIVGATLVDGRGGLPVTNSVVLVRSGGIEKVGTRSSMSIPPHAEVVDAAGLTLVPGLIDSHFHIERDYELPRLFLAHGVTSIRDPGQWLEIYEPIKSSALPQPRCFVAGPHLDSHPHAHPKDAFAVMTSEETRAAVNRFVDEGASHIKVYYRLPLELIRAAFPSLRISNWWMPTRQFAPASMASSTSLRSEPRSRKRAMPKNFARRCATTTKRDAKRAMNFGASWISIARLAFSH